MIDPFGSDFAPTIEPNSLITGKHAIWRRDINIDSTLFTISYVFTPSGGGSLTYTANSTYSDGFWVTEILGGTSVNWESGEYTWDLVATRISDSAEKVVQTGSINFFATSNDRRTHAQIMLKKIESILEGRADHDVESYSIRSRSITKMSVKELREWREYYIAEVDRQIGDGLFSTPAPDATTVRTRFR